MKYNLMVFGPHVGRQNYYFFTRNLYKLTLISKYIFKNCILNLFTTLNVRLPAKKKKIQNS